MISKDQKYNIICTIGECGETFYGRHTAQHPAAVIRNNNKKFRSFKSKENIHKKEVGPYHGFGYLSFISDPIKMAKGARGKYYEFASFNDGSRLKARCKSKNTKLFQI